MNEATSTIHTQFPVFARHQGTWEGIYKVMDVKNGQILDQHRSKVTCRMFGNNSYQQTNEYSWSDGRTVIREFPGEFRYDALCFDNSRLTGRACEVNENTICLFWTYNDKPDERYSELITLENDKHRCRTWQHFENGDFVKITVIDEHKTA